MKLRKFIFMKQLTFLGLFLFFTNYQISAQKLEIDLRSDTANKKYVVGLAIRNDSFTGHAFVILYQQDKNEAEKKAFKVYGYYPKRIANIPIPIGVVKNDSNCLKHIPQKASYLVLGNRLTFLLIILLTLQLPSYGYNMVLFDT